MRTINPPHPNFEASMSQAKISISNTKMTPTWKDWVTTNLNRNVPRKTIYETLRKNGFGLGSIQNAMGIHFPEIEGDETGRDTSKRSIHYDAIANCQLTRTDNPDLKRVLTSKAQVFTWKNFLTESECHELIALTNTRLRKSTITTEGKEEDYAFRTSSTCYLHEFKDPIVQNVENKIASALGISASWSEPNQAQKYEVGQEFKAHTDYFEPGAEEYKKFCSELGQRTWTFMIYLNKVEEGGGTRFRKLAKTFTPETGMAVIWNSLTPEGDPNPFTIHHGTKVRKGEKFVITKWFRDSGEGPMLLPGSV
jgi:prolyl 4-hydroxylase